jgi:hypothetical protein
MHVNRTYVFASFPCLSLPERQEAIEEKLWVWILVRFALLSSFFVVPLLFIFALIIFKLFFIHGITY